MNLGILTTLWNQWWQMNDSNASSNGDESSPQRLSSSLSMESLGIETLTTNGFEEYNALNDQLLRCIMTGKGSTDEAEGIRNRMNDLWQHMSLEEHTAIRRYNETAIKDKTSVAHP